MIVSVNFDSSIVMKVSKTCEIRTYLYNSTQQIEKTNRGRVRLLQYDIKINMKLVLSDQTRVDLVKKKKSNRLYCNQSHVKSRVLLAARYAT